MDKAIDSLTSLVNGLQQSPSTSINQLASTTGTQFQPGPSNPIYSLLGGASRGSAIDVKIKDEDKPFIDMSGKYNRNIFSESREQQRQRRQEQIAQTSNRRQQIYPIEEDKEEDPVPGYEDSEVVTPSVKKDEETKVEVNEEYQPEPATILQDPEHVIVRQQELQSQLDSMRQPNSMTPQEFQTMIEHIKTLPPSQQVKVIHYINNLAVIQNHMNAGRNRQATQAQRAIINSELQRAHEESKIQEPYVADHMPDYLLNAMKFMDNDQIKVLVKGIQVIYNEVRDYYDRQRERDSKKTITGKLTPYQLAEVKEFEESRGPVRDKCRRCIYYQDGELKSIVICQDKEIYQER